jgi:cell division protein FtsB
MRHHRASAIYGIVNQQRIRLSRRRLAAVAVAAVTGWMVWSFAQEVLLSHDLSHQAAELRQQNAALQSENRGYQRDIAASTSGAAAEEEARGDGYSKPREKLYLVGDPPPPTAPPKARTSHPGAGSSGGHAARSLPGTVVDWLKRLSLP